MDSMILHATTRTHADRFATHPGQALLLHGPHGVGKTALARALVAAVLQVPAASLDRYPYVTTVTPDDKHTISIDAVRQLQRFLQLRTTGKNVMRRAVIIAHADALTTEAQNALLKLLEEPPADTIVVLTAANVHTLLPTIRSRTQAIPVREPDEAAVRAFFEQAGNDARAVEQAYLLSGGLPGLMHALLTNDTSHPLMAAVSHAKQLLGGKTFDRLAGIDALSKQKADTYTVLDALMSIAKTGLRQAAHKHDQDRMRQWHRVRKQSAAARNALERSAHPKLVLTKLMLHI